MSLTKVKTALLCVLAASTAMATVPAQASVTIHLNDIGGVKGTQAERGFRAAAKFWESVLDTHASVGNINIRLNVGYANLGAGILGSTGSTRLQTDVLDWQDMILGTSSSTLDAIVAANLPNGTGGLSVIMPGYKDPATKAGINTLTSRVDNDGSTNNRTLLATTANTRALLGDAIVDGIIGTSADATIRFNTLFAFDFDPSDGITAGQSDFIAVAAHEIGHALGFTSGVDALDANGCPSGPNCAGYNGNINNAPFANLLDMFRYSDEGELNWRPNVDAYFSIDGGATELFGNSNNSTGAYNGDGRQASHWKAPPAGPGSTCVNFIGIMNPYLCSGTAGVAKAADLAVFDALGYSLRFDVLRNPDFTYTSAQMSAAVPEPATWALMIGGFGLIGGSMRRRSRKISIAYA